MSLKSASSLPFPGTVTSSFASTSRAAAEFKIDSLHWFGLDLDHTLVRYHLEHFFELVYNCIVKYMLEIKGESYLRYREFLEKPFEHDFLSKGLVFEFATGNILRLDSEGTIIRASHGTRQLSWEEIIKAYGTSRLFTHFADAATFTRNPNYEYFTTYFDMPAALICARLVDAIDALDGPLGEALQSGEARYDFRVLIRGAFTHNFDFEAFAADRGWYFPELKRNTSRYIYKRGAVRRWLEHLRKECKVRIFLLTNSHADYSECLLNYSFGADWKDVFDLVICRGMKPTFFNGASPFYYLDRLRMREGATMENAANTLQRGDYVVQGNVKDLVSFFECNKKSDPLYEGTHKRSAKLCVAYSGDHIHGDVMAVNTNTDWWTVAVLEEMWDDYHNDFTHAIPLSHKDHHCKHAYHLLSSNAVSTSATTASAKESALASSPSFLHAASSSSSPRSVSMEMTTLSSSPLVPSSSSLPLTFSFNVTPLSSAPAAINTDDSTCCESTDENEAKEDNEFHVPTFNILASKRWGSFFVHSHQNGVECEPAADRPSKRHRTGFVEGTVLTHLAHLIINHSTIVVPCLSALANFEDKSHAPNQVSEQPLNLPSALSGMKQHGFHPYLPTVFHGINYSNSHE